MKFAIKVVAVNLALTGFLLSVFVIGLPALLDLRLLVHNWIDQRSASPRYDRRYELPMYREYPWALQFFKEFTELKADYHDYIVWRHRSFHGKAITIDDSGYRRHGSRDDTPREARSWMFGGSATWGDGSSDELTIPAFLEKVSGERTFNLGELGYTAHQSLNLLMRLYVEGGHPGRVVFFDGANEVQVKCRRELSFYSSDLERVVSTLIEDHRPSAARTPQVFKPLRQEIAKIFAPATRSDAYDCDRDPAKAELVALSLVNDWKAARLLVEADGGKFLPVLQPVAFMGKSDVSYLDEIKDEAALRANFEAVYPRIRTEAMRAGLPFLDLTNAFDGQGLFFIDPIHVVPRGNEVLASAIHKAMQDR